MDERKQTPAEIWRGLMAAKEVADVTNISRAKLHSMLKLNQFPQPAIRIGSRFTRWKACDVQEWLADPAGWIAAHAQEVPA